MNLDDELSAHHHASHQHLLTSKRADYVPHAYLDAVIVPASRQVDSLCTALDLAGRLGCVLVALCSRNVTADQVLASARKKNVSIVAIDIVEVNSLPAFDTSHVVDDSRFKRTTDLSHKRNMGLLLARVAGWQRVMFLDDDIDDVHPSDVRAAAGLLGRYDVVGFKNKGFADNSVVCRISDLLEHRQDQFIGAGALVVAPQRMGTFFPDIYNEDWFFMAGTSRMAVTGSVGHRAYGDAIAAPRAREEELGDCLGEALYWARDNGASSTFFGREHWRRFLDHRRWFIEWLGRVNERGLQLSKVRAALDAAHEMGDRIAAERAVDDYMELWRSDLVVWQRFVSERPTGLGLVKALTELGWDGLAHLYLLPWHEEDRLVLPGGREWSAADQQDDRSSDPAGEASPFAQAVAHRGVTG